MREKDGRGSGGRCWRAWIEERDGRDKIERELSVTVTETGSVGGGGEQQSRCARV